MYEVEEVRFGNEQCSTHSIFLCRNFNYLMNFCYKIELLQRNVANPPSEEDVKLMKRVCGAFNTNAFETVSVQDKDHSSSLRGLYPMGALQNHCCVPNTRHHFDGEQRLYVNAALPISAGEELTMSYTSLFWDTTLRRQFLSVTKHFSCTCKRCSDPTVNLRTIALKRYKYLHLENL